MVAVLCALTAPPKKPLITKARLNSPQGEQLTVFITGNELGTLKPCGCTGGQLGGLDRRMTVFETVPVSRRLIIDTGALVDGFGEQDQIKFNTIVQAYNLLGYDLVNLTEADVEIARTLGLLDIIGSVFHVIRPKTGTDAGPESEPEIAEPEFFRPPTSFSKEFLLACRKLTITVGSFDVESDDVAQIDALFNSSNEGKKVNILIVNRCDSAIISSIRNMQIVDCLICPAEADRPEAISKPGEKPLVVTPGQLGKYVGRLEIKTEKDEHDLKFGFSAVAITGDLPQEQSLVDLYKLYQEDVKAANLLEKQYRRPLPNGLEYLGSKTCRLCHKYEYEKWSTKAHARAYETLEKVGSQYDPECVICHVVGMEYEGGFVNEVKTAHFKDVGCEICHGPGSEHIAAAGKKETSQPMKDCADCHTPEHSGGFAGHETEFLEKIVHWREPNAPSNVK